MHIHNVCIYTILNDFRVQQFKDHIIWNKNDTVSFRNRRKWNFVPEMSNGSLLDKITNVNVVAVVSFIIYV